MAERIQAQVSAQFSDAARDVQLLIEPDPTGAPDLDVHLLLFPAVGATLAASHGRVRYGREKTVDVPGGVALFSGSSRATLPKIPHGPLPGLTVLYSFDTKGLATSVSVSYDVASGELRAGAECFAAVSYGAYRANAFELIYSPLVEPYGLGVRTIFGAICAFYPPRSQIVYQVQPFNIDEGNVELELYRIVSNSVANADGEFERPTDYPASGAYTGTPGSAFVLDVSQSLETERVHEIGYMNLRTGLAYVQPFHVRTLEPFIGDHSYVPTKRFIESPLPAEKFTPSVIAKAKSFVAARGYGKA